MPVLTKALLAAALVPMLASATQTNIPAENHPEIVRVDCDHSRGSAFWVGEHVLLSVAHVTTATGCQINGRPIKVIYQRGDFAMMRSDIPTDRWLRVDCGGFVKGRNYVGRGFARGFNTLTEVDLEGTGYTQNGQALLVGVFTVQPGQSGGPIVGSDGRAVGTVNTYRADIGVSGSVPLKDTVLCEKKSVAAGSRLGSPQT